MKSLRLTGRPDPAFVPEIFRLVADSRYVREARLVGWNLAGEGDATLLFTAEGDLEGFRGALPDEPPLVSADLAAVGPGHFVLLLRVAPDDASPLGTLLAALRRGGIVVVKPVVYRDGQVLARVVGEARAVQSFVETFPPTVAVEIHEVGSGGVDPTAPAAALSDRQREAVLAGLELGYYESPKGATHRDVADELGCAPSTASEHLQKAEATLVREAMRGAIDGG